MQSYTKGDTNEFNENVEKVLFSPKSDKSAKISENMSTFEKDTEILRSVDLKLRKSSDDHCHLDVEIKSSKLMDQSGSSISLDKQVHSNIDTDGTNGQIGLNIVENFDHNRPNTTKKASIMTSLKSDRAPEGGGCPY